MTQKVLVVDDEISIVTLLKFNLEKAGYDVITALDGQEAVYLVETYHPNLIVLDLMLPKLDGLEVCKLLRQKQILTPILMLTAKDDEFDKVLGLEIGADDYMTKPFSPREVVAKVKAILRRISNQTIEPKEEFHKIVIGELEIFPERFEALFKERMLDLTPKEFEMLHYLAKHRGRVLTREQLLGAIWDYSYSGGTRIVDVHVSHLRDKMERNTRKPRYIKTIRGLGYKLEAPHPHE
ncbi:response regulator transcription factor [Bacillus taeanensis]|uniref:DNA-binding response regulator n=1 Tax=Bacillus taeanensis TaxID=273032 RepID=A0A366XZB0_9BACI|nr:response regulator transcription factor [Bacillus taeanensis]RBW71492.1 DNA-binding response regulator [Bacillus taeanensis]